MGRRFIGRRVVLPVCWFLLTIQRACRSVVKRAALSLYLIGTLSRYMLTLSVIESNYGEKWVAGHRAWLSCDENGEIDGGRAGRIGASRGERKKGERKKVCTTFQWRVSRLIRFV